MNLLSKAMTKYRNMPMSVKAPFWVAACSFIQQAIPLLTSPIFTRMMSTDEYGVWTVFSAWTSVMTVLVTLNLQGGGFNNAMLQFKNHRNAFVSSMVFLELCLTLIWGIILLVFQDAFVHFSKLPIHYLAIMIATLFFNSVFGLWAQQNRFEYKYKPLLLVTIIGSVLIPVSGILAVYYSTDKVLGRMTSNLLVAFVLYSVLAIIVFVKGKTVFKREYWKYALVFNLPLVFHYLSQIVLSSCDRIMIGQICGESYAGIYGVSYTIANIVTIVLSSISGTLGPWLYEKLESHKYDQIPKVENALAVFFAVIALGPILVGPEVVWIMGPEVYQAAIWVIPPVSSSVFFMYLYNIYSNFEFFYEKRKMATIGSVITAVANVGLNYIFINQFGFIAAGYTTLICYVLYAICHGVFCHRLLKAKEIDSKQVFNNRFLWLLGGVVLVIVGTSNLLYLNSIVRYCFLAAFAIIAFWKRKWFISIIKTVREK